MSEYLTETYGLVETENGGLSVRGRVDGLTALRQAVYLMLNIEQGRRRIFSDEYGVELAGLLGERREYVVPELERRLREALCRDERVLDVTDFVFDFHGSRVSVSFVIKSVYGELVYGDAGTKSDINNINKSDISAESNRFADGVEVVLSV